MGPTPIVSPPSVEFAVFAQRLAKLLQGLMMSRAHAEVQITLQDGTLRYVRVSRGYLPGDMPDV